MPHSGRSWTDERVESIVGFLLRGGVITAAVFVLLGGFFYLIKYGSHFPEYKVFSGEPADLRTVYGIVTDALWLRSRGIIQFGLLILMATPVARVAFLFFAFARQRDRTYVVVTLIVLSILIYSLGGGYRSLLFL
ncbi:MAG: DUF1634 domain-containing protein [Nitrospirae bacterium]|nr:DUF1634 domain-containing protein [Nitrospirota bacterium]